MNTKTSAVMAQQYLILGDIKHLACDIYHALHMHNAQSPKSQKNQGFWKETGIQSWTVTVGICSSLDVPRNLH